ncbi:type III secretion system cytoplasmic ring protein SctQ [Paraburkholderia humisilvae]|nr:type III secretion system cytoplasmic ring protein SctQ [Paraburkholderia humisilvae]
MAQDGSRVPARSAALRPQKSASTECDPRPGHEQTSKPAALLYLPQVDPLVARVSQTLCDKRLALHLSTHADIEDLLVEPFQIPPTWENCLIIELMLKVKFNSFTVFVGFNADAYPILNAAIAPCQPPSEHETASPSNASENSAEPTKWQLFKLRSALARALIEPALTLLQHCGFTDYAVMDARPRTQVNLRPDFARLVVSCRAQGNKLEFVLYADAKVETLTSLWRQAPAPAPWPLYLPGRLVVGIKRLSFSILRSLASGDVIMRALVPLFDARLLDLTYETCESNEFPQAWAIWGTPGLTRVCAAVRVRQHLLEIIKEPYMSDVTGPEDSDHDNSASPTDDPVRIDDLEIPVTIELDIVKLSLAQLSSLGSGYVVELDAPVSSAQLRLVAHGQTVGYGELVAIGEHLGVRILRMAGRYGSDE